MTKLTYEIFISAVITEIIKERMKPIFVLWILFEDEYKDCVGFAIFREAMLSLMYNLVKREILVNHIISISKRSAEYINDKDAWLKFITKHEKKACREVTKNVILTRRVYTTMFFESLCREFRDLSRAQILDENWFPDLTAAHIQRMNAHMGMPYER